MHTSFAYEFGESLLIRYCVCLEPCCVLYTMRSGGYYVLMSANEGGRPGFAPLFALQ